MKAEPYLRNRLAEAAAAIGADVRKDDILLERPKNPEHGDLSTNLAMQLPSQLHKSPREIAAGLMGKLDCDDDIVAEIKIAGPGFINFVLSADYFRDALSSIVEERDRFGEDTWGRGQKVQFEFVSANPTGPLNVVSARAATVGDVLARLHRMVGYDTETEYYVNDAGRQVRLLGESVSARYMHLFDREEAFPDEGYHGEYIIDLARQIKEELGDKFVDLDHESRSSQLGEWALNAIIASQKEVLSAYRVNFDNWFHERTLRDNDSHSEVIERLDKAGYLYDQDGAKWFRSSEFGDEKDRVLVTSAGEPTYFLIDIAYHLDKYERGYDKLFDLWGPDHHGYIARMKAALRALGYPEGSFEVSIIQQVNLLHEGEAIKMSKRAGKIIEMAELLEEVGVDVARFFFLERRSQSPLDFDMELAKKTTEENPVFYIQYAHARICNVLLYANEQSIALDKGADLALLDKAEELALIKKMLEYPESIANATRYLEPHRLPNYLQELAATFHHCYHCHRVVTEDRALTQARLILMEGTRIVLKNALSVLGIMAPERM